MIGNLSDDFSLREFKVSKDHPEKAEKMKFRPYQVARLRFLCKMILQPVRDKFGRIDVLSGKRTKTLNKLVFGAVDSDHLYCIAADIYPAEAGIWTVYQWIKNNLPYRELILHEKESYIHVSVNIPCREWKKTAKEIGNV